MELAVFGTTLIIALPFFLFVSITLITLIKMMGFTEPSVFKMSRAYFTRWLIVSVLASLLTTYINAQSLGMPDYTYTLALFFGLGTGMFALIALDLLAIRVED